MSAPVEIIPAIAPSIATRLVTEFPNIEAISGPNWFAYLLARFFSKVDVPHKGAHKCWKWTGHLSPKGYGAFTVTPGVIRAAHVVSFLLFDQEDRPRDQVCHRCDNPACVNPSHLFWGTNTDNFLDSVNKGRRKFPAGEAHGCAKLKTDDVRRIKELVAARVKQRDIASEFGVSQTQIWRIAHGQSWGRVST